MQFTIIHEIQGQGGRLRARSTTMLSLRTAKKFADRLAELSGVTLLDMNARTGSFLFWYEDLAARARIFEVLPISEAQSSIKLCCTSKPVQIHTQAPVVKSQLSGVMKLFVWPALRFIFIRPLLPMPLRILGSAKKALPHIITGLKALLRGKLNVDVLDATAIVISLVRADFRTVSLLTFLLSMGEALEHWTRQASRASLAESLSLDIDTVWVRREDGDICIPLCDITTDDLIIVRAGSAIVVDGVVEDGEAIVNQASMTGEPEGVLRRKGGAVFAGTVIEEGSLVIRPTHIGTDTRLQKIVNFIEDSQALKASIEGKALRMADMAVPFTFALAGLVYFITRDPARAASVLLVDYSCALRLATPLAILAAMREGASNGVLVKGGVFLENLAHANTVVFDKTGTLTEARPKVAKVVGRGEFTERDVLRLAACLEEHFPHPVARAITQAADEQELAHREEHSEVEYVVAHGIVSKWHGKRVLLGSRHYIHEDEKISVAPLQDEADALAAEGYSILYLVVGEELAGIIGIEDSLRPEARSVIDALRASGIERIVMLTGDDARTAKNIAVQLGVSEYYAEVLPVDKATVIQNLQKEGARVIMVGDGMNDAPALSIADVGVSMRDSTDLAREVADVVLLQSSLKSLVTARLLGQGVLQRIKGNFAWNMGLNSAFLGLSLAGIMSPGLSAILHNLTTIGVTVNAMRPLLSHEHKQIEG